MDSACGTAIAGTLLAVLIIFGLIDFYNFITGAFS